MHNLSLLEEYYQKFIKGLESWNPEGIYFVNLDLLSHFDLLHFQPHSNSKDSSLTRYFHIIESTDKITLFNDDFIIWIIPDKVENGSFTSTLIALNRGEHEPQLEVVFIASGIYNSSTIVLKVLEKFLEEIQETQKILDQFTL